MHERIERGNERVVVTFENTVLYVWSKKDYQERKKSKCSVSEATEFWYVQRLTKSPAWLGRKKPGSGSKEKN